MWWLGIVGFLVMLVSAMTGLAAWRGQRATDDHAPATPEALFDFDDHPHRFEVLDGGRVHRPKRQRRHPRAPRQGTFMQRLERRWQRRREQGGF
jgi:hypothetical protein